MGFDSAMAQVSMQLRVTLSSSIISNSLISALKASLPIKIQVFIFRSDSPKGHGLTTNNARIETIRESKLYRPSLETNKRCVVVCDGK